MNSAAASLEGLLRDSRRALVIGGGGDVVGALACARLLEFIGMPFVLGGVSWERAEYDPVPNPRRLCQTETVRALHPRAWRANAASRTDTGAVFAESHMAAALGQEILLVDIDGGAEGAAEGLDVATRQLDADLPVGIDVGGDSLADGGGPGLRSPLADSIRLAAWAALQSSGKNTLWDLFSYGSDGESTADEIEPALSRVAAAGGLLGSWSLTPKIASELDEILKTVPTEASAVPLQCIRGANGTRTTRGGNRRLKLTPLSALTVFMSPVVVHHALARPPRAVARSKSLEQANDALHAIGIDTELDFERGLANARTTR